MCVFMEVERQQGGRTCSANDSLDRTSTHGKMKTISKQLRFPECEAPEFNADS